MKRVSAMLHELKAEYEFRAVLAWHVVPAGDTWSLCGNPLAPAAATRSIDDMAHLARVCRPCEVLHLGARRRDGHPMGEPLLD